MQIFIINNNKKKLISLNRINIFKTNIEANVAEKLKSLKINCSNNTMVRVIDFISKLKEKSAFVKNIE
jgi:hypothetical protein